MTTRVLNYERRTIALFLLVLTVAVVIGNGAVYVHQRHTLLQQSFQHAEHEVSLIIKLIAESLIKSDYAAAEQFVDQWGADDQDVIAAKIVSANDFTLAHYRRNQPAAHTFSTSQRVNYGSSGVVKMEVVWDTTSIYHGLNRLLTILVSVSVLLIAVLLFFLWWVLRRALLNPVSDELTLSERYNRMLFEQSPVGLALSRLNGELVDVNEAYAHIIGRTVAEALHLSHWDITPDSYSDEEKEQLAKLQRTGCYGPYEKEYVHKDGHRVPVRLQGRILEKDGEQMIWSSVENIAERKSAEEAIEAAHKRLADAQRLAHIGSWELDLKCNTLLWSDEVFRIFELDPERFNATYEAFLEAVHPDDRERVNTTYQESLKSKKSFRTEHRLRMPDGRIKHVQERCETFYADDGHPVRSIGSVQDITDRVTMEEALRRSQKMEAIGQLSGGIAHDFNNQLSIIIGFLDFLREYAEKDEKPRKWVRAASDATERCITLTRQLLAFSRRQSKETSVVDLNALLNGLKDVIARSVTPEVEVQYHLDDKLWTTEIDSGEFQDAILNLVINARDAMPSGGKFLMETVNVKLDADYTDLNPGIGPGDFVRLSISDTGMGMSKETLDHVFEPFFTTKPEGKGTGLGLAMVYGFVKRYEGYIKIYSERNEGTTVHLYLPRSAHNKPSVNNHFSKGDQLPRGSESVLIVDDEAELLELANQYLSDLGYRTHTAVNGRQAMEMLEGGLQVELLFSDVVMPGGMNGYELAQQATARLPKLKVMLTSGFTSKVIAENGLARFSANLLGKPYRKADLAHRVRLVLDKQR